MAGCPAARGSPARALAAQLGVVRNVAAEAYDVLGSEGYVVARQGSGTYISQALPDDLGAPLPAARAARAAPRPGGERPVASLVARLEQDRRLAPAPHAGAAHLDLRPGIPAGDLFPHALWKTLVARALDTSLRTPAYGPPLGEPELRTQLAAYLGRARAVRCRPEQIVVTAGSQQALDLLARLLLDPGDRFAIEDPGYHGARRALVAAGGVPRPVPVDGDGLDVDALDALAGCEPIRLVYVTPSHQYPSGPALSLARRLALVDWAAQRGTWILEDDYDGEFRYAGRPLPALQGLDGDVTNSARFPAGL